MQSSYNRTALANNFLLFVFNHFSNNISHAVFVYCCQVKRNTRLMFTFPLIDIFIIAFSYKHDSFFIPFILPLYWYCYIVFKQIIITLQIYFKVKIVHCYVLNILFLLHCVTYSDMQKCVLWLICYEFHVLNLLSIKLAPTVEMLILLP